jgi:Histidine kinase-, DNA gyrase B-, and HSP90-like ATPase
METLEVIPDPVSLIESMRAVGYSVEAAVADIIDNSLSATATNIRVKYDATDTPFIAVLDDGIGMGPDQLTAAMRHGSSNPLEKRSANDLGRFGLGLKTASLSQCRRLTVISKKGSTISGRRWDLDVVQQTGRWLVVVPSPEDLRQMPMYEAFAIQSSGTLVVWQDLDRLTAGSDNAEHEMTVKMTPLFEHLALVFHRFTQAEESHPAVKIVVNGLPLPLRDPFLSANSYRQELEGQTINHERGKVIVLPFVLPPVSNLSSNEIEAAGGREGLRGTQGFYVYRSRRLVIWGTWFRLVPKEEFYKLTRIRVDIPNSFDDLWALDIKKSAAYPPDPIRSRLKELIPHFANTSKRAITYKGRHANSKTYIPLWNRIEVGPGKVRYEPNSEHILIRKLSQALGDEEQRHLQMILDFLGSALPYDGIYADMCDDSRSNDQDELMSELLEMAESLVEVAHICVDQILQIDPICRHPELHKAIKKELEK